ncbi:hypothetical protein ACP4OV_028495 [Aristida adscensionis]
MWRAAATPSMCSAPISRPSGDVNTRLALDRGTEADFDDSILRNIRACLAVIASDAALGCSNATHELVDAYLGAAAGSFARDFAGVGAAGENNARELWTHAREHTWKEEYIKQIMERLPSNSVSAIPYVPWLRAERAVRTRRARGLGCGMNACMRTISARITGDAGEVRVAEGTGCGGGGGGARWYGAETRHGLLWHGAAARDGVRRRVMACGGAPVRMATHERAASSSVRGAAAACAPCRPAQGLHRIGGGAPGAPPLPTAPRPRPRAPAHRSRPPAHLLRRAGVAVHGVGGDWIPSRHRAPPARRNAREMSGGKE